MDPRRAAFAAELHAEGVAFDAAQAERHDRRRNVKPDTAALLGILVRTARAHRVLEIGTSNGYSALWLGDALEHTGGSLTSLDIHPGRSAQAQANLEQAGLAGRTELLVLDAREHLAASTEIIDLVFLDADRSAYVDYWPDLLRLLRPDGGTLVVDNAASHPEQVAAFRALVDAEPTVDSVLVPTGAGALLVTRWDTGALSA